MKPIITWTRHADERYYERFAPLDIWREEMEIEIEKQEVKIPQGYDPSYKSSKYQAIFQVRGHFATVEKAEREKEILVITLWGSSEKEKEIWKRKRK